MLRRILSLILILSLLCTGLPVALSENAASFPADDAAAEPAEDIADEADESDDAAVEYKTLVRGDRDGDDSVAIVTLQNRLIELGYLRDAADGVYGANTEDAVATLQRSNNLAETGEADPALQQLLYSGAALVSYDNSMDPESVTYRTQEKLAVWGFLADEPDGKAGSKTRDAIVEFKTYTRAHQMYSPSPSPAPTATPAPDPDGMLAPIDMPIVLDVPIDQSAEADINADILDFVDGAREFEVYQETLSNGDEGDEVLRMQRRLFNLKYLAIVDGAFGPTTERALIYFQKKNGLPQSAVADEATQRILFSEDAVESEEFVNAYKLIIDVSEQKVHVYQWNGSDYSTYVGAMICSTGLKATPTPLGTYQAAGPTGTGEWYWFKEFSCYAKWATRIVGGILFHSVTYSKGKVMNRTALKKLGRPASHGCVRLKVDHAKWIYENCHPGTTVIVQK